MDENQMQQVNTIYILPFAGGSSYSMNLLKELLEPSMKSIVLEYPGHGTRFGESLIEDINELVNDLLEQVYAQQAEGAYTIYGHCMGGLLAWLLTKKISDKEMKPPTHLFVSGTGGPAADNSYVRSLRTLDDIAFMNEFVDEQNESQFREALQDEDLFELFKGVIRADFYALGTFYYLETKKLSIPVTVVNGTGDNTVAESDIRLWSNETTAKTDFVYLPGNHFFIFDNAKAITDMIKEKSGGKQAVSTFHNF
jgi:surfactin synthase thioesterase subunit